MKKLFSFAVSIAMILSLSTPTFAVEAVSVPDENPYDSNLVETNIVEGIVYTYYYDIDNQGNKSILIIATDGRIDTIVEDKQSGNVYLNGALIATNESIRIATRGWSEGVEESVYISWLAGTATAVVAGIIAVKLGGTVMLVLTGAGIFAAACSGGTLSWTKQYNIDNGFDPKLRTTWSFVANTGDEYGPFSYTITR